jgi:hypothetical protein
MRGIVFSALALLAPTVALSQESAESKSPQPRNQLPAATAEPENAKAYAPPAAPEETGPTEEDRGPAQRHFIIASQPDDMALEDNPPAVGYLPPEKVALDKRIRVDLIHDVEDGSSSKGMANHAIRFEIEYINWGAVTAEQLAARRGHYFTISWTNAGPRDNFTARFQYRQVKSKGIVRVLEEPMPNVRGTVRSYFAVVSKAFLLYGPVASWRFAILRGDTVVAETKSFIW